MASILKKRRTEAELDLVAILFQVGVPYFASMRSRLVLLVCCWFAFSAAKDSSRPAPPVKLPETVGAREVEVLPNGTPVMSAKRAKAAARAKEVKQTKAQEAKVNQLRESLPLKASARRGLLPRE